MPTSFRNFPCLLLAVAACSIVVAEGCGRRRPNYDSIGLVEVTGRVTEGGSPLAGAYIVFESPDNRKAYAVTDADGDYRLNYNSEQTGVMPGEMKVRIRSQPPMEEGEGESTEDHIPAKYNTETILQATVEPGEDQRFNFDL